MGLRGRRVFLTARKGPRQTGCGFWLFSAPNVGFVFCARYLSSVLCVLYMNGHGQCCWKTSSRQGEVLAKGDRICIDHVRKEGWMWCGTRMYFVNTRHQRPFVWYQQAFSQWYSSMVLRFDDYATHLWYTCEPNWRRCPDDGGMHNYAISGGVDKGWCSSILFTKNVGHSRIVSWAVRSVLARLDAGSVVLYFLHEVLAKKTW